MKPYRYILFTIAICIPTYFLLNVVWHYSSSEYKPSSVLIDIEKRPEDVNHLWDVFRKGHTQK